MASPPSRSAIDRLADAATARADGHEADIAAHDTRLRTIEITLAEQRGAAGGLQRMAPWIALVISLAGIARSFL